MSDPFFETVRDQTWNACVGSQGTALDYVLGYLEAAKILADTVIDRNMLGSRDALAMPILYNVRHGLELALKYAAEALARLEMAPAREGGANHDILSYFEHLRDADVGDLGVRTAISEMEPFVASLAGIDGDGQELRYYERRGGGRSLTKVATINLTLVRASVERLGATLVALTERIDRLKEHHHTGTRTTRCSRDDLELIAAMLGRASEWSEPGFEDRKREVMDHFSLSRKAFSNAVDAIRASRPLTASVGIEMPLLFVTDEAVVKVAERWRAAFPPDDGKNGGVLRAADFDFAEIEAHTRAVAELVLDVEALLGPDEFADVEAIFCIGRNRDYGEEYKAKVERTRAEHARLPRRSDPIRHIVSKLNFLEGLSAGLRRVGRPSLADVVESVATRK